MVMPGREPDRNAGTPRWVVVFGIIGGALILVVVVLHLMGYGLGGHHAP
jgi:hypothetical protein